MRSLDLRVLGRRSGIVGTGLVGLNLASQLTLLTQSPYPVAATNTGDGELFQVYFASPDPVTPIPVVLSPTMATITGLMAIAALLLCALLAFIACFAEMPMGGPASSRSWGYRPIGAVLIGMLVLRLFFAEALNSTLLSGCLTLGPACCALLVSLWLRNRFFPAHQATPAVTDKASDDQRPGSI